MYNVNENEYEPTSLDSDIFLSEIPMPLLKENIKGQFEEPLENRTNYLKVFIDKFAISKELCDEDSMNDLYLVRDDFMEFLLDTYREYLGVGIVDFDDLSEEEQDDLIQMVYEFFIMNIKKNFVALTINYIDKYRKSLSEISGKKKDVTTLSFKREVTNTDDLNILANLSDIIDYILTVDIDVTEFLSLTKQCLETSMIDAAYDNFKITGNFVDNYKDMLDKDFKRELENKVRNKILKKYKKTSIY